MNTRKIAVPIVDLSDLSKMVNIILSPKMFETFYGADTDKRDNETYDLGHGLSLVLDKSIKDNKLRYCRLVKDGVQISDNYYRLGGLDSGFNSKPYASIILYKKVNAEAVGIHVIIDANGKVVLEGKGLNYPYYFAGVIGQMDRVYYNLLTGKPIVKGSTAVESESYYFVENKYNDEYPKGVYKITKATGEYEIFN
jgi:hypothetical protein